MRIVETGKFKALQMLMALVVIGLFMPVTNAFSQKPFFRSVKVPDEIQQTTITCLYQDNNRYMWIGTGKGLYQFDGNDFIYYPGNDENMPLQVSALYMTADHVLWIGTRKGNIFQFKGDSLQLFNPEEGNPKVAITGFASDNEGKLWFATYGEGIYCYNGKQIVNINTDDGLTDNYCYTLTPGPDGRIWTATDGGISVCSMTNHKKNVRKITTDDGLPDNIVLSLTADGTGMWAGMQDAGFCNIDISSMKVTVPAVSKSWDNGPIHSVTAGNNWLWLSTERNGIISYEPSSGQINGNYTHTGNQNLLRINELYADKQGDCWIASGSQLFFSLGNDLLYFTELGPAKNKNIHSVLSDSKGFTWFSNDEGLFKLNSRSGKTEKIKLSVKKATQIISLFEDKKGYIWAGTFGSGLFCIDPAGKRSKLFGEADGLSNGNILAIAGKGNQLWLATLGGGYTCSITGDPLSVASAVSFTNINDHNFPGNSYIYSVFVDSHNRVWFGTDGRGISMLENGRFTNFDKAQGLKSNIIYSITEDSDGDIWFSTSNAGIYRYNGKSFQNYSIAEGLSELHVTALLADKNNHILIVHTNGIDILDTRNNTFLYYSSDAGMSDINPDLNACSPEGNNTAWIGTQNGLIRIQIPVDIANHQPSLQLNRVSVLLGNENYFGTHIFSNNQNHITFHYNALWYIAPSQVKYQIRLKGYDLGWSETRNNMASYPNLAPGDYTFEVRSAIKGDFLQSEIKTYSFTVKKPLWKTNWFIIASVILLALLLYLIILFRERAMKQREANEREKIMFQFQTLRSQVNPHFLFNSFSTLISIIDEDKDIAIDYVEKLSQFFRAILDYRDTELIPLSEELKLTDTYYYLQKKRYCENLNLEIEVGEKELNTFIPPMVLQMLVENAIKHNVVSAEKPLKVRIFTDAKHIMVINNLQPKKAGEPSTGIGLANIRNRYLLLGFGETVIDTTNDEFCVKLPLIHSGK